MTSTSNKSATCHNVTCSNKEFFLKPGSIWMVVGIECTFYGTLKHLCCKILDKRLNRLQYPVMKQDASADFCTMCSIMARAALSIVMFI